MQQPDLVPLKLVYQSTYRNPQNTVKVKDREKYTKERQNDKFETVCPKPTSGKD